MEKLSVKMCSKNDPFALRGLTSREASLNRDPLILTLMIVMIFPVIGHLKGAGELLKKRLEEIKPDLVLCRLDPDEEIVDSPITKILKKFGIYEERYCEYEAIEKIPFKRIEIGEEEVLKGLPKKFSVWDLVKYNLFLKRLSSDWENFNEFLSWWEKAALSIKHIKALSEIFADKILEEIKVANADRILVVADYLTSKVLKEKLEKSSLPYKFENYIFSSGIYSTKDYAAKGGL